MFQDKFGNHIRFHEAIDLATDRQYSTIEYTTIEHDEVIIETTWLGPDAEAEEYFQSCVVLESKTIFCCKYTTIEEAVRGHKVIVGTWLSQPELVQ